MSGVLQRIGSPIARAWRGVTKGSSSLSPRTLAWGSLALAAILLLSVNLIASIGLTNWQADLPPEACYPHASG
jgi:type VI protein secretion system component VasF